MRPRLTFATIAILFITILTPFSAKANESVQLTGNDGVTRDASRLKLSPEAVYGVRSFFGFSTTKDGPYTCKGVDDPICTAADTNASWKYGTDLNAPVPGPLDAHVYFYHLMSVCDSLDSNLCVTDLYAVDVSGNKVTGQFVGKYHENAFQDFEAVPEMNLSASKGKGLLFRFPGVINSGGTDTYMLMIYTGGSLSGPKKAGESLRNFKIKMEGFHAELIPYRKENIGTGNNRINPTFTRPEEKCYFNRDDERDPDWCPVATKFPKGYRFGMTIKFHDSLAGWFHGRLGEPKFDFKTENNLAQVSVEAAPIALPVIDTAIPVSQVPRSYLDFLIKNQIEGAWHGPLPTDFELKSGGAFGSDRKKRFLFEEYYSATYKVFNDQSTYTQSVWRFGTLGQGEISDRCKAEGFAGMVSTNALAYAFGPPEFNSVSQSLDYKLSSPHFDETGMANLGSYDLAIDTKLARCLYGFTDAPISASISVISASGEARVAI
jgi:hypothetical protein